MSWQRADDFSFIFDRAMLTYPRSFVAQEDHLFFSAPADGAVTYTLIDFSAFPPFLLDISDPRLCCW